MSSSTRILLGRKAGNEKALFISPGSTMRQLYRPVKRMSPGNLWQIDGYYVGSMSSQERKQRRFPLILTILLTLAFPPRTFWTSTTRPENARRCGKPAAEVLEWPQLLACSVGSLHGLPSVGLPKAVIKIISSATDPPFICLSSLLSLSPGYSHFYSTVARITLGCNGIYNVIGA